LVWISGFFASFEWVVGDDFVVSPYVDVGGELDVGWPKGGWVGFGWKIVLQHEGNGASKVVGDGCGPV
jgi:hypothetical protein